MTPIQREDLSNMPVNPDSGAIDRETYVFQCCVTYFLLVENYLPVESNSATTPPDLLVIAMSDVYCGQRCKHATVHAIIWEVGADEKPRRKAYHAPFMPEVMCTVHGKLVCTVYDGKRRWISTNKMSRRKRIATSQLNTINHADVDESMT
jgi:hypothetical protein